MWRNTEVAALIDWMRAHNEGVPETDRCAGFYGLDLYNISGSIEAVLDYLDKIDPEAAKVARERYGCLTPWQKEPSFQPRGAHRRLSQMRAVGDRAMPRIAGAATRL
jgi:erythromycin esterase-like protein